MAGPAFLQPTSVYYIDTRVKCKNKCWSLACVHRPGAGKRGVRYQDKG